MVKGDTFNTSTHTSALTILWRENSKGCCEALIDVSFRVNLQVLKHGVNLTASLIYWSFSTIFLLQQKFLHKINKRAHLLVITQNKVDTGII